MSKKLKQGVECADCHERLFSWHVHDFHYCNCGNTFIDGGDEYIRYGYKKMPKLIKFNKKVDKRP